MGQQVEADGGQEEGRGVDVLGPDLVGQPRQEEGHDRAGDVVDDHEAGGEARGVTEGIGLGVVRVAQVDAEVGDGAHEPEVLPEDVHGVPLEEVEKPLHCRIK